MNFNAREIFDIGVQIEANGKAFYEAAAKKTAETATREFFLELAAWEGTHITLFSELRAELTPLVERITAQPPADDGCLRRTYPEALQWQFNLEVARRLQGIADRGATGRAIERLGLERPAGLFVARPQFDNVHQTQINDVDEQFRVDDFLQLFPDHVFGQRHVDTPSLIRTYTSSPSTLTSWTRVGTIAGMVSGWPVRMSNWAPWRGQAIAWSHNRPSPKGPPSWVQTSSRQ